MMSNTIKIAEIPIYGTDYETFHQKWECHIQHAVDEWVASGWDKSNAEATYRHLVFPRSVWQYAQVVGFVTIAVSATDVIFEVYAPVNQRYHYNGKSKINIQCWHTNGLHFPMPSPPDNHMIIGEIYKWIDLIKKDFLPNYYLDLSVFDAISSHLDYAGIINQLSEKTQASYLICGL